MSNAYNNFISGFKTFISKRNVGNLCRNCINKSNICCNCTWKFGPPVAEINKYIISHFALDNNILRSRPLKYTNIFEKLYSTNGNDKLKNFIWSSNVVHVIFPLYNLRLICDRYLISNITYFRNFMNDIWQEKVVNFKYYDYDLLSWFNGPRIIIVDEKTSLDMICFDERPYETVGDEEDHLFVGKKWYTKTFYDEVLHIVSI